MVHEVHGHLVSIMISALEFAERSIKNSGFESEVT